MTKTVNVKNFDLSLGDNLKSIAKAVNSENHKQPESHETLRWPQSHNPAFITKDSGNPSNAKGHRTSA